jgi:hypothetical protein
MRMPEVKMKFRHVLNRWALGCALGISLSVAAGAAGAVVQVPAPFAVSVAPVSALSGATVDFTLSRSGVSAFDTLDLTIDFDSTVLALSTTSPYQLGSVIGEFFPSFNPSQGVAGNRVTAFLTASSISGPVTDAGDLVVARFSVLAGATLGNTLVNFQSPSASVSDPGTLFIPLTSGTLVIGTVPEPGQWMTLLAGLALFGTVLVRRRRA